MDADPRVAMVEVCHLLAAQNLTSATGGNVSVRVGDGSYWVTPSRLHKSRMRVEDLVRVDGDFRVLEGARKPSSESLMHLAVYRRLPQAGAVVHAHPPVCGGFALAGKEMDTGSSSEAVAILGPRVPLIGYARPSTAELAELVGRSMAGNIRAYLMANHGALTWGTDLWDAYDMLDTLENFARSLVAAMALGGAVPLDEGERRWLEKKAGR